MDILTNILLPLAIAILASIPGLIGLWMMSTDRRQKTASTESTIVQTALSLVRPLEERIEKQSLFIDELQARHDRDLAALAAKDAQLVAKDAIIEDLLLNLNALEGDNE